MQYQYDLSELVQGPADVSAPPCLQMGNILSGLVVAVSIAGGSIASVAFVIDSRTSCGRVFAALKGCSAIAG
jgi:hypothetical protein